MKIWIQIAFLFLAGVSSHEGGVSKIAAFAKSVKGDLLVYGGETSVAVLSNGKVVSLDLARSALPPANISCCRRTPPSLSQDSKRVAYVRMTAYKPHREVLAVYDINTRKSTDLFEATEIWSVAWFPGPDDRLAIIARQGSETADLYIVTPATRQAKRLTAGGFTIQGKGTYHLAQHAPPSWSPAGDKVAFEVEEGSIAVWDIASGAAQLLASGHNPAWSPQGNVIAFLGPGRDTCLAVDMTNKGGVRSIASAQHTQPRAFSVSPVWSPGGDQLLLHSELDDEGHLFLYRVDIATGAMKTITLAQFEVVTWRSHEDAH